MSVQTSKYLPRKGICSLPQLNTTERLQLLWAIICSLLMKNGRCHHLFFCSRFKRKLVVRPHFHPSVLPVGHSLRTSLTACTDEQDQEVMKFERHVRKCIGLTYSVLLRNPNKAPSTSALSVYSFLFHKSREIWFISLNLIWRQIWSVYCTGLQYTISTPAR